MNTKITALFTAAILGLTSLSAVAEGYYPDVEFPNVNSSDFIAVPIDIEIYKRAEAAVRESAKQGVNELNETLYLLDSIAMEAKTSYALAYIKASQNNTEENNKAVSDIYSVISEISESMSTLIMDLYNDPSTRNSITEWMGGEDAMQEFIDTYPTERYYELSEQENQLLNQYRNSTFGSYVYVADDGNSYTLESLEAKLTEIVDEMNANIESDDFDFYTAYMTYERLSRYTMEYLTKSGEQLGEIFSQLVKVRTEIAKESGFDNYADYAHASFYNRDYSTQELGIFRENVKKHIVPLATALEDIASEMDTTPIDEEEIVPAVQKYIGEISPELSDSFNFMIESELVDMEQSPDKVTQGVAYTMDIPVYGVPFVFISPVEGNTAWTLETLVHEYGHFNANLYRTLSFWDENAVVYTPDIDMSEIHSQGLEMLFTEYYDDIYSKDSSMIYLNRLYSLLCSIIDGCMYDEWQEEVYKNPEMTVAEMNDAYVSISAEYGIEQLYDADWTQVPHNFEEPMYYISYAVSAVAALDIWSQSLTDRNSAIDRYLRTTAYNSENGFCTALSELGYNDIFAESTLENIANNIYSYARLGYNDISINDWYWQAVLETKGYIDDSVKNGSFRPQEGILRSEMANSIGMMHETLGHAIPDGTAAFIDAADSKYIAWAADNGIIKGYDSQTFGSADTLTREQAVTILYRYANGYASSDISSLDNFKDYTDISDWAADAFVWAVNEGIIRGVNVDDNTSLLNPQDTVTRAEAAQMIARLSDGE